jgi:predicted esterase
VSPGIESEIGRHSGKSIRIAGRAPAEAGAAMILVHGRGATADDILSLAGELEHPEFAYLAPQAVGNSWYPNSFLAPRASNEPGISSGLGVLQELVTRLADDGIASDRVMLLGFSQGACLTLEFVYRQPKRYGGVVGLTGGLIGPPGTRWEKSGSLDGTPIYLGSSDPDPHVPWSRVEETAGVFGRLAGEVTLERYPGLGHTVHRDQLVAVRRLMRRVSAQTITQ